MNAFSHEMLNQMASKSSDPKMFSANYVENYLDSVENLPNDVQRYLTRIREIDLQCKGKCDCLLFYCINCGIRIVLLNFVLFFVFFHFVISAFA